MMNDRFSAELRQHLLAAADERPADGRLAAIIDGVAVTAQRRPVMARLTWFPRRIGPFPSAAVRYGLVAAALVIAIVAAALAAGVGPTRPTVFEGTWQSTDPGDGSRQTLVVGGGPSPAVHFEDAFATGVACQDTDVTTFVMDGLGTVVDDRLDVIWPDGGGCGPTKIEIGPGSYRYDSERDTITDGQDLTWARLDRAVVPTTSPQPSAAPSTEPLVAPTPLPREGTFTSRIHGFSMGVPKGWQTRAATEPWTGERLDFDSPQADVIFDPRHGENLYLVVASQPFVDRSGDAWKHSVLQWTCAQGRGEFWSWNVDGTYSEQVGPCNSGSLIETDTRGYLIRLVASTGVPGLGAYDWDFITTLLETVDLRPEDAVDPPGTGAALPPCAEIAAGTTYTNRFGSPSLTATIPVGAESSWHGSRDNFELGSACPFGGSIWMTASTVDTVLTDPCDPAAGVGGDVSTAAEAADAMAAHIGHRTSEPTDIRIDGHDALRLEISTEGSTCKDAFALWPGPGAEVNPGQNALIYLVDTGGQHPLGIGVWYDASETTPARLAEAEAIVKSIQIESP